MVWCEVPSPRCALCRWAKTPADHTPAPRHTCPLPPPCRLIAPHGKSPSLLPAWALRHPQLEIKTVPRVLKALTQKSALQSWTAAPPHTAGDSG